MATTLQEVARSAGVSLATASRVLNGSDRHPGPEIASRVRATAESLGYVPHAQAQALARATSDLVGLVVHDIADPYFSTIAGGVQSVAQPLGKQTLLASTGRDPQLETAAVRSLAAQRTQAIILAGSRRRSADGAHRDLVAACRMYERNGGRLAFVGQQFEGFPAVVPDNAGGARRLARALVETGHRRFAVVEGPRWLRTSVDRADAFCREVGPERVAWSVRGDFSRAGGYGAVRSVLEGGDDPGPLCVFAVSDVMALGVLAACRDLGLRVPEDVAVAGFDAIPTLLDVTPTLTTVALDLRAIGARAAELALDGAASARRVSVAAEVRLRDSTALGG
ncbi:LacI family DNA-binding transcriptional regulator [Phycicoccus jejuensis]|uniref:LacI family DNA-binding transcriptional regulator n=1 Tax=Phycicoccus jejuensis TaxID=367299 RepID=UPI0004C3C6F9|nr:LacI family DNA-binding transcriptional regulator [Phycicoccus jejuensis]